MESKFLAIGKSDIVKSIGVAMLGTLLTAALPMVAPILAALKAGILPTLPGMMDVQTVALKAVGNGLETGGVFLAHKLFSDENGSPFNGALGKYMAAQKTDAK